MTWFPLAAALLGLWVSMLLTPAIERLPYEEEPEEIPGIPDDEEPTAVLWYDKMPLLNIFVDLWRWSDLGRLAPRPHCPRCKARIALVDRLPLISHFRHRGACRACGFPVSGRHLLVEVATALLFAAFAAHFGATVKGFEALFMVALFVVASVVDWRYQIIPDEVNLVGLVGGLLIAAARSAADGAGLLAGGLPKGAALGQTLATTFLDKPGSIGFALLGVLAGSGALWLFYHVGTFLAKTDAMGGGDIKLAAFAGAFLGPGAILVALLLSAIIGSLFGILVILWGDARREGGFTKFAFGPYICMGVLLTVWFEPAGILDALRSVTARLYGLDTLAALSRQAVSSFV